MRNQNPISSAAGMKVIADEPANEQNRANLVARVGDQKRAHHGGDRAARAQIGNRGSGIDGDLREHRYHAARKVERRVAPGFIASSISGPNAQRNTMLPRMCDQLACMNNAVRMVIQ